MVALGLICRARTDADSANARQVSGIISDVALSFIVQEPSGIIARSSARSRSLSLRMQRSSSVSERWVLNTGWVRKALPRFSSFGSASACAGLDLGKAQRLPPNSAPHRLDGLRRRGLVERDAERGLADPQVDPLRQCAGDQLVSLLRAGLDGHGIEEGFTGRRKAELA